MRVPQSTSSKIKTAIHATQGALLALAWILTIAVFAQDGSTHGATGWYFGLCWLSFPIIIYLTMVPMWSRTQRFSNVYAFATLDILSVILWLSAWAAVAAYVAAGKSAGTNSNNASGCDNFGFGSPAKCKLSEATIIIGVFIMLLFAGTAYLSVKGVMNYKRTGIAPSKANDFAVQSQDAFSTNMQQEEFEGEEDLDARQGGRLGYHRHGNSVNDEYALLHHADQEDISQVHPVQPSGPLSYSQPSVSTLSHDTSYGGVYLGQTSDPVAAPGYNHVLSPYGR